MRNCLLSPQFVGSTGEGDFKRVRITPGYLVLACGAYQPNAFQPEIPSFNRPAGAMVVNVPPVAIDAIRKGCDKVQKLRGYTFVLKSPANLIFVPSYSICGLSASGENYPLDLLTDYLPS